MDELGFNKIAGAVLATALGVMILREAPHFFMHSNFPDTPAYTVGPMEVAAAGDAVPLPFPQASWVNAMDNDRGTKVFKKCQSCHNAQNGGANGTGPNLWNVVGSPAAKHPGFKYSSAFTSSGITWTYEELDHFLKKPTKYVSGTNMNFVGLKKAEDRAAVIEHLRLAADSPEARPEPVAAPEEDTTEEMAEAPEEGAETPTEDQAETTTDTTAEPSDTATEETETTPEETETTEEEPTPEPEQ
ncbi:c-type cytochrome [Hellea sp.]|nr:c-type cytochrome [Hellea sp.]